MGVFSLLTLAALVVVAGTVVRLDRTGTVTAAPAALSTKTDPVLTDRTTGLSYTLLGAPWRDGCRRVLSTAEFRWTAGEAAVAGPLTDGSDWYANACSGPLPSQFRGKSQAAAAWGIANAIEPLYYGALHHSVTVKQSAAIRVSGMPGWLAEFQVRYTGAQRLAWSRELGAVVVTGDAMFYISVPDDLGTGTIASMLSSLR